MSENKKNRKNELKNPDWQAVAARDMTNSGWNFSQQIKPQMTEATPLGIIQDQPASTFVTAEDQAKMAAVLQNPEELAAASGPIQSSLSFLGQLFDYNDSQDNVVEWGWDGLWRSLGWGYDKINHGAAWAVSAAPAGIDTFTWDQANQISFGQASLASGAANQTKYGNVGGFLLNKTNLFGDVGAALVKGDMAGPLGDANFDVTDPQMRKAAFEDSTVGKVTSGLTDAVFVVVADPLLFAGKIAKVSKLRYLDDMFQGEGGLSRLTTQFADSLVKPSGQKAPAAQFVHDSTLINPETGEKVMSRAVMMKRLKGTTGGEYLVNALYANTDELTGQLLMRYAFGDIAAGEQLLKTKPALMMGVARRQREEIRNVLANSPDLNAKLLLRTENALKKIDKEIKKTPKNTPQYSNLIKHRNQAQETFDAVSNGRVGDLDDMSDPRLLRLLSVEFKDVVGSDEILAKFLLDEYGRVKSRNIAAGGNYGFARDTALGRRIERSRLNRAQLSTDIAASRRSLVGTGQMAKVVSANGTVTQVEKMRHTRFWEKNEFNINGFTRAINVWRWMGEANPSGHVATKGAASMGSWKEIQAMINDVDIFSGASRSIIVTSKDKNGIAQTVRYEVGGKERGQELLESYIAAMHDSTAGENAVALAAQKIEVEIFNEIAKWHGLSENAAKELLTKAQSKRDQIIKNFENSETAFWTENGKIHKAPWVESQIQNGTYLINMKSFNKLARMNDETGVIKRIDTGSQFVGQNLNELYNAFNEVWRPSVLLRLGYTQRNVMEGLFRATAFTFSLDPVRWAIVQAGKTPGNAYRKYRFAGALQSAESAALVRAVNNRATPMPKYFDKWLSKEIDASENEIERLQEFVIQPGRFIDDVNVETKEFMEDFWGSVETFYTNKLDKARTAGAKSDEIRGLQSNIDDAVANRTRVANITEFQLGNYESEVERIGRISFKGQRRATADYKAGLLDNLNANNDELLQSTIQVLEDLRWVRRELELAIQRRANLNDDVFSLSAFRQQGQAKSRVMNGTLTSPDGTVLAAAFNPSNEGLNPILSNLSADPTTKAMSVSSANTMTNAFRVNRMKHYVNVSPGDRNYFNGVASALRQVKYSEIGKMAIDGRSVDEIAKYLIEDGEGKQILEFIVGGWNNEIRLSAGQSKQGNLKRVSANKLFMGDKEDAYTIANNVIERYNTLAPSPELQEYMKTLTISNNDTLEETVKTFLSATDSSGNAVYDLKPVIGHIGEELGIKGVRETINQFTSTGMKWLGTYPEDALVRIPFYGKRYEDSLSEMIRTMQASVGDRKISMREYNQLREQAHLRALKDTKEWMFTIERRTNLGTYGEIAIPFISAMQNSVTTVGRLIWRDPSIAVLMTKIWQAPSRGEMTDEQGNIVIPIPHAWIPDGVENALGITDQLNMTFSPTQFNLIAPQLDTGLTFQIGPVVAIPAAEIIKHGFFGVTPETPSQMVALLGKEDADTFWQTIKAHTFGAYRNDKGELQVAEPASAVQALLPAWMRRAVQLFEKDGNIAYARIYNANYHTEYSKWRAGLRINEPKKEEITNMTNNLTIVQMLTNLTAAFPPRYESTLQPVVDDYRNMLDSAVTKDDADRMFTEKYGVDFLVNKTLGMSETPVSTNITARMVTDSIKYKSLISKVSPTLKAGDALDSLSIVFSTNENEIYDGSVSAWQRVNAVPGISDMYRSSLTPDEAWAQDAKSAGWSKWLQAKTQFDVRLAQSGYTDISQWPALQAEKNALLFQMAADPMYRAWFTDYKDFGSQRTTGTIQVMQAALGDSVFVADHKNDPIWQAASEYLTARAQVLNQLTIQGGGSIKSMRNMNVANWWNKFRSDLKNVPGWDVFSNRWLDGDDDPINPGVSFATTLVGDK